MLRVGAKGLKSSEEPRFERFRIPRMNSGKQLGMFVGRVVHTCSASFAMYTKLSRSIAAIISQKSWKQLVD